MTITDALIYARDIGVNNRTHDETEVYHAPSNSLDDGKISAADRFLIDLAYNLDFDIDSLTNEQVSTLLARAVENTHWKRAKVAHVKDKSDLRSHPNLTRIEKFHEDVGGESQDEVAIEIALQLNKHSEYFFWKRLRL